MGITRRNNMSDNTWIILIILAIGAIIFHDWYHGGSLNIFKECYEYSTYLLCNNNTGKIF